MIVMQSITATTVERSETQYHMMQCLHHRHDNMKYDKAERSEASGYNNIMITTAMVVNRVSRQARELSSIETLLILMVEVTITTLVSFYSLLLQNRNF